MGSHTSVCAIDPDAPLRTVGKLICSSGVSDLSMSINNMRLKFTAANRTNCNILFTLTHLEGCDSQPALLKPGESATIRITRSGAVTKAKSEVNNLSFIQLDSIKTLEHLIDGCPHLSWFSIDCAPKARESRHEDTILEVAAACYVFEECELPSVNREGGRTVLVDRKRVFTRGYYELSMHICGARTSIVSSRAVSRSSFSECFRNFISAHQSTGDYRSQVDCASSYEVKKLDKRDPCVTEEQFLIAGLNQLAFAFYRAGFTKLVLSTQRGHMFVDAYNMTNDSILVQCPRIQPLLIEFAAFERATLCFQCDAPQGDLFVVDECRSPIDVQKKIDLQPFRFDEQWVAGVERVFDSECIDLLLEATSRYVMVAARFRAAFDLTLDLTQKNYHIDSPSIAGGSTKSSSFAFAVRCDGNTISDENAISTNTGFASPTSGPSGFLSLAPASCMESKQLTVPTSFVESAAHPRTGSQSGIEDESKKTVIFTIDSMTYTLTHRGLYDLDVNVIGRYCVGNNISQTEMAVVTVEKNVWRIPPRQHFKIAFPAGSPPVMNIRAIQAHDIAK